jgi:hypothetical protein
MRSLDVYVKFMQDRLELARTEGATVRLDCLPASLLLRIIASAEAAEEAIGLALDRVTPGYGRDARTLAALMREAVPPGSDTA